MTTNGITTRSSSVGEESTEFVETAGKEFQVNQLRDLISDFKLLVSDFEVADIFEKQKSAQQCTAQNWKSILQYIKFDSALALYVKAAIPDKSHVNTIPLQLVHDEVTTIEIYSERLQKIFLDVVDVSCYSGVTVSSQRIAISPPYTALFHELERLKEGVNDDSLVSEDDKKLFRALYYYLTLDSPQTTFKDVNRLLERGTIFYSEIWALFSSRTLVVSRDHLDNWVISRVMAVAWEEDNFAGAYARNRWFITTSSTVRIGGKYQKLIRKRRLEFFQGAKRIRHLDFFPIEYLEGHEALRATAVERGKEWREYCEDEPKVMSYKGQALPMLRVKDNFVNINNNTIFSPVFLSTTVMVDHEAHSRVNRQSLIDETPVNDLEVSRTDVRSYQPFNGMSFTNEDLLTCPATQLVFDLDNHEWYSVNITDLQPKDWRPESFDRLVMNPTRKDTLKRITMTSFRKTETASHDAIEGKGKGLVLLLYGPPGVGKTMTAEALAQLMHKPLLKVNLGRLSSHKRWEQALDQIFDNGEAWKAILLIDEAEVVLEKRTFERMTQNSWISVFLRKLEYYQGVLILTTNLIDCMDDAFESRIMYPIQFEELSQEDRRQIWIGFIEHLKIPDRHKKELLTNVDKWSEAEINGRQIRNTFTMAENLAESDGRSNRLTADHIDQILEVIIEFTEYNKNKYSKKKKGYLAY